MELLSISVPLLRMPPPSSADVLLETVVLVTVITPALWIPPPYLAELPETVELLSVNVPLL